MSKYSRFTDELASLLNSYSIDNELNTPDYILAEHITTYLCDLGVLLRERDNVDRD